MSKNKKIKAIGWAFGYFGLLCSILISASFIFHNNYYSFIYVDGISMTPNLNANGKTEFGIVDSKTKNKNFIKRFDIVTTYYPIKYNGSTGNISDYCYINEDGLEVPTSYIDREHKVVLSSYADFKIKRVIALPGEQFKVKEDGVETRHKENETWSTWEFHKFDFKIKNTLGSKTNSEVITLEEDQYWVIGDNWDNSVDSVAINSPVYYGNIKGVLIAIEGTCTVIRENGKIKVSNKNYYFGPKHYKR